MRDRDFVVEVVTEKDSIEFLFASYDTAADFVRTAFIGLTNMDKAKVVKICIHEDMEPETKEAP